MVKCSAADRNPESCGSALLDPTSSYTNLFVFNYSDDDVWRWMKKHWKSKNYEATPYAKPNSFLENEDSEAVNPFQFHSFVHYSFIGKSRDIC